MPDGGQIEVLLTVLLRDRGAPETRRGAIIRTDPESAQIGQAVAEG